MHRGYGHNIIQNTLNVHDDKKAKKGYKMNFPGVTLEENEHHELILQYKPTEEAIVADAVSLRNWIDAHGFHDLLIDDMALRRVTQEMTQGGTSFSKIIGRRLDANYDVTILPDRLTAYITIKPAYGGLPASKEGARAALTQAGVCFGIQDEALEEALGEKIGQQIIVAKGVAPEPSIDGRLETLITVNRQRHPKIDQFGMVDFRDLGEIPTVDAGQALMRRHPPEQGRPGRNVLNEEIPSPPGKEVRFGMRMQGVTADASDPNVLVSSSAGLPVLLSDGISIEPTLKLDNIDLNSGNIDFVGSVFVHGDIRSGMQVKVGGDLTVEGTIEAAEIETGGDVIAKGGIVGHTAQNRESDARAETARIHAKGSVRARYIENAIISAEHAVFVEETIVQSDIMALATIEVGRKGSKKGHILGGFIRATLGVTADFIGGPGSGQTRVFVGFNPLLQRAFDEQKHALTAKLKEHADISKIIKLLANQPEKIDMLKRARNSMRKISEEINEILEHEKQLKYEMEFADHAEVIVMESVFSGSMIAIGKKSFYVAEDMGRGVFSLEAGAVTYGSKSNAAAKQAAKQ